jgi:hypothetical protein
MSTLEPGRRAPFALVPEWVVLAPITPPAKALYALLVAHTNSLRGDGIAWPGMDTMAVILGYSRRQSVSRYVRELQRLGALEVRVTKWAGGRRNTYVVHELPPDGYSGYASVVAFHKERIAISRSLEGGGTPERTTHGAPERPMGSAAQRTRNRRTEPPEGTKTKGTSSGGTPVGGDAAASPRPFTARP